MLAPRARRASLAKSAFAAKTNASLILAGERPASGSPAPWLCAAAWEPLLPRYAPHDTKFRLDNLDSQSNYGIDVLVLLDGKEIFK